MSVEKGAASLAAKEAVIGPVGLAGEDKDRKRRPGFDPDHKPTTLTASDMLQVEPLMNPDIKITLGDPNDMNTVICAIYSMWSPGILSEDGPVLDTLIYTPSLAQGRELYVQVIDEQGGRPPSCMINHVVESIVDIVEGIEKRSFGKQARFDDVRTIQTEDGPVYRVI